MTRRHENTRYISVRVAVRRSGLTEEVVHECVRREMVVEPLTEADLAELRRIRRLRELGVNLPGIEIILHMRRRIQALQADVEPWSGRQTGASRVEWIELEERWQRLLPSKSDK